MRLITLTLRADRGSLGQRIDRLYESFRRLRQRTFWKTAVTGAAAVLEVTRGREGRHWHTHLHIVATGQYLPQNVLSAEWLAVTGNSPIVDVRSITDADAAARYVAKYLGKGLSQAIWDRPEILDEYLLAVQGRQMILWLGEWRGIVHALQDPPDPGDWKTVASLDQLAAALSRRETWALGIARSLWTDPAEPSPTPE